MEGGKLKENSKKFFSGNKSGIRKILEFNFSQITGSGMFSVVGEEGNWAGYLPRVRFCFLEQFQLQKGGPSWIRRNGHESILS